MAPVNFNAKVIAEPQLEFGGGGRHVDPRFGLVEHGPLQPLLGDTVRIGVIGTGETADGFAQFIERCRLGIDGKSQKLANLYPPFPGAGNRNPFRCTFEVDQIARRIVPERDIQRIIEMPKQSEAVTTAADLFAELAGSMLESSARPDVIACALPTKLIEKLVNAKSENDEEVEEDDQDLNFRDLLKSRSLPLSVPTQIVWPTLWDDSAKIPRKLKETLREVQDPATRAWNLLNAIFYKAGKVPWKLPRAEGAFATSFLGIGFYKDLSGQRLLTSTAQMFDERGRGLILRGARARTDRGDRHPYLEREDAYDLLVRAIKAYRGHHGHAPARLVVLKTSRFQEGEADGIARACDEFGIDRRDLIWVSEHQDTTLVRDGNYPMLRGSFVQIGRNGLLFTRGSVPYYRTYPGLRVPQPILLRPHSCDTPISELATEVLSLTKMNWNSTQFDQASPIPIRAARQVGRVLKYLPFGQTEQSDYRFYS
ncbi:argonaute/piwi family protein [Bradyrhizobium diazoefficiens]|uniref:argonaute/piwi family protein n=1 Tax=Bradyrhizobium diazoefficiens TaxID=1355477 RepID=UPI001FEFADE9|nr:hypothetical protein [Bradyrhizobium diazoefficiens]